MADDAFALSPISARAAQPSEADYDAIQEAFMETSRGRWFLGEYAKRNRNADTRMVLDAVARIEETLAASRKPVRDPLLDQALESFRAALTQAREAAHAAVTDLALEQNLAPVRKGARVIREIAWRLREIGADGRICDLIDSQVGAIEAAAVRMAPVDLVGALSGAFDRIEQQIATFDASETAVSPPPVAEATPQAAEVAPVAVEQAEVIQAEVSQAEVLQAEVLQTEVLQAEVHAEDSAEPASVAHAEAIIDPPPQPVAMAEQAPEVAVVESEPHEAFDANDEALLDMVAMEMAAPDSDAAYEPKYGPEYDPTLDDARIDEEHVPADPADEPNADEPRVEVASYEIEVTFPQAHDAAPAAPSASTLPAVTPLKPAPAPEAITMPMPAAESTPSLGSSLIANGIVPRPRAARPDPLAPIRRMSQTEKIAFFS